MFEKYTEERPVVWEWEISKEEEEEIKKDYIVD